MILIFYMLTMILFYNLSNFILLRVRVKLKFKINKVYHKKIMLYSTLIFLTWTIIIVCMFYYAYNYMAKPAGDRPDVMFSSLLIAFWGAPVYWKLKNIYLELLKQ